jgi:hypothetical protein
MKDRENQTTTNNEVNSQTEALTDLPVADEQADDTTAGASAPNGRLYLGTQVGVF